MTLWYFCPGQENTISGGTRKLFDHVAILQAHGYDAQIVYTQDVYRTAFAPEDIAVIPEVYGDGIRDFVPASVRRRVIFVQNGYLLDAADGTKYVADPERHPYMTTPELVAIFTESEHTSDIVRTRFPDLKVPIIRTHSSGNGRRGEDAGFHFGAWPRKKVVCYFDYKHASDNRSLFEGLNLPDGWMLWNMSGSDDEQIAERMRTSSIFVATNRNEGMCAPTSEAMISGCAIVCWTGGGPDEYLVGRSVIAAQDDVDDLREAIESTAQAIDENPEVWAVHTRAWSDWFQETYSRQKEIDELLAIFDELLAVEVAA